MSQAPRYGTLKSYDYNIDSASSLNKPRTASPATEIRKLINQKEEELLTLSQVRKQSLESMVLSKDEEVAQLQTRNAKLTQVYDTNLKLLLERDQELERYDALFIELSKTIRERDEEVSDLKVQREKLEQKGRDYDEQIRILKLNHHNDVVRVHNERDVLEEKRNADLQQQKQVYDEMKMKMERSYNDRIGVLEQTLETTRKESSASIEELVKKNDEQVNNAKCTFDKYQRDMENELHVLRSALFASQSNLQETTDRLENVIRAKDVQTDKLEREKVEIEKNRHTLLIEYESKVTSLLQNLNQLEIQFSNQREFYEKKLNDGRRDMETIQKQLENVHKTSKFYEEECKRTKSIMEELENQLRLNRDDQMKQSSTSHRRLQSYNEELSTLQQLYDKMQVELNVNQSERESLKVEMIVKDSKIVEMENDMRRLHEKLEYSSNVLRIYENADNQLTKQVTVLQQHTQNMIESVLLKSTTTNQNDDDDEDKNHTMMIVKNSEQLVTMQHELLNMRKELKERRKISIDMNNDVSNVSIGDDDDDDDDDDDGCSRGRHKSIGDNVRRKSRSPSVMPSLHSLPRIIHETSEIDEDEDIGNKNKKIQQHISASSSSSLLVSNHKVELEQYDNGESASYVNNDNEWMQLAYMDDSDNDRGRHVDGELSIVTCNDDDGDDDGDDDKCNAVVCTTASSSHTNGAVSYIDELKHKARRRRQVLRIVMDENKQLRDDILLLRQQLQQDNNNNELHEQIDELREEVRGKDSINDLLTKQIEAYKQQYVHHPNDSKSHDNDDDDDTVRVFNSTLQSSLHQHHHPHPHDTATTRCILRNNPTQTDDNINRTIMKRDSQTSMQQHVQQCACASTQTPSAATNMTEHEQDQVLLIQNNKNDDDDDDKYADLRLENRRLRIRKRELEEIVSAYGSDMGVYEALLKQNRVLIEEIELCKDNANQLQNAFEKEIGQWKLRYQLDGNEMDNMNQQYQRKTISMSMIDDDDDDDDDGTNSNQQSIIINQQNDNENRKNSSHQQLEMEIVQLTKQNEQLRGAIGQMRNDLEILSLSTQKKLNDDGGDDDDGDRIELMKSLDDVKQRNHALEQQIDMLKKWRRGSIDESTAELREIDLLRDQTMKLSNRLEESGKRIIELQCKVHNLQQQLYDARNVMPQQFERWKERVLELEQYNRLLEDERHHIDGHDERDDGDKHEREYMKQMIKQSKDKQDQLHDMLMECQLKMGNVQLELDLSKTQLEDSRKTIEHKQDMIDLLRARITESENRPRNESNDDDNDKVKELDKLYRQSRNEIDELMRERDKLLDISNMLRSNMTKIMTQNETPPPTTTTSTNTPLTNRSHGTSEEDVNSANDIKNNNVQRSLRDLIMQNRLIRQQLDAIVQSTQTVPRHAFGSSEYCEDPLCWIRHRHSIDEHSYAFQRQHDAILHNLNQLDQSIERVQEQHENIPAMVASSKENESTNNIQRNETNDEETSRVRKYIHQSLDEFQLPRLQRVEVDAARREYRRARAGTYVLAGIAEELRSDRPPLRLASQKATESQKQSRERLRQSHQKRVELIEKRRMVRNYNDRSEDQRS